MTGKETLLENEEGGKCGVTNYIDDINLSVNNSSSYSFSVLNVNTHVLCLAVSLSILPSLPTLYYSMASMH